jgi:hypothetical protein
MRLKVISSSLTEEVGGRMRGFVVGEEFDHPDDERARRLLAVSPAIVEAVAKASPAPEAALAAPRASQKGASKPTAPPA